MSDTAYQSALAVFNTLGKQRVWSLLVTMFGDLAQAKGQCIPGALLSRIFAEMEIKPEAVRVALHRLRNDGWIMSSKQGRTSTHTLTDFGRSESAVASRRIYAAPSETPSNWQAVVLEAPNAIAIESLKDRGFAPLNNRIYLGAATADPPDGCLVLVGTNVPNWFKAQFEPAQLALDYAVLHKALSEVEAALPENVSLTPLQVAVLRCLIVHGWRRLVLKHPDLPAALLTSGWKGHACHEKVFQLLGRFPRPDLADLDCL